MASQALPDRINQGITDFGQRVGSDVIYDLGARMKTARFWKTPRGLGIKLGMDFQEAARLQFKELGFVPPAYTVKEFEDGDAWRLRVEDVAGKRSYELAVTPDRLDPRQLNVHAAAYKSLDMLTFSNKMDEWKGSLKAGGEQRLYMEAVNAAAMVLSWLDPLAAPEATVSGSGSWAPAGPQ